MDKLSKLLNFNFEFDHKIEISESLKDKNLHLTEYSSCVLDGLNAGVPSICFHPIAKESFSNLEVQKKLRIYNSIGEFLTDV